jgi:hypothetical protein
MANKMDVVLLTWSFSRIRKRKMAVRGIRTKIKE